MLWLIGLCSQNDVMQMPHSFDNHRFKSKNFCSSIELKLELKLCNSQPAFEPQADRTKSDLFPDK